VGPSLIKAEELATRIPSVKALLARNGAKFTKDTGVINRSIKDAAVGLLLKQPFVYHYQIDDVASIYKDIAEDNLNKGTLAKIAFTVTLGFEGGIFGLTSKSLKKGRETLSVATLGRGSMLDDLSRRFADGNPRAWVKWLDEAVDPTDRARRIKHLRITQEMNLQRWGTSEEAVSAIALHISANESVNLAQRTFGDFMDRQAKYLDNFEAIDKLAGQGLITDATGQAIGRGKIALGSFDRVARDNLAQELKGLTYMVQVALIQGKADEGVFWAQNEITRDKVLFAINNASRESGDISKAIQDINTAENLSKYLPKELADKLGKDGYIMIVPERNLNKFVQVEDTRKLVTSEIVSGVDSLTTKEAIPALNGFHGVLYRAGLSPESANDIAYKQLYATVTDNLSDTLVAKKIVDPKAIAGYNSTKTGKTILTALQDFATKKPPNAILSFGGKTSAVNAITDIRQLTIDEIVEAMSKQGIAISKAEGKEIAKTIIDGYKSLPMELRGLGDRFTDNMFKYVPGFAKYNRVQSALRYTYNPFFRVQESVETKILSKMRSGNLLWGKTSGELDNVAAKLDDARIFNTGFSGEGARNDVVLGRITANIGKRQKRDLAGLATKLAENKGLTVDQMLTDHIDELEDALRVIVQYPSRGVLNSPLARTLNLAFFPMRYNIKVAGLAAQFISKQPPVVQLAIINSVLDANKFLKSDEGIRWKSDNSEALGVLRWVTPIGSVESVVNLLGMGSGSVDSISSLGVLGGLPAGVFFQILDSQGAFQNIPGPIKYSTPYVNPKTGEVFADKIPDSAKAKAAVVLTDFINSTFTYPGRIIGLPGKGLAIRDSVGTVFQTNKEDYHYVDQTDKLTDLQRRQSEILKNRALDDLTDDELLTIYQTEGRWSIPNLAALNGQPKVKTPTNYNRFAPRTGLPSGKIPKSTQKKQFPNGIKELKARIQ